MTSPVTISPATASPAGDARRQRRASLLKRAAAMVAGLGLCFAAISVQLVRLALEGQSRPMSAISEPVAESHARPDIVDRNGRLLATDVEVPSLFADPTLVIDRDEAVERLKTVFSDLDAADLRRQLSDKTRRFVWIKRGLSPKVAQRVHDLGLPGFAFRSELARAYPGGELAGHVLGAVNVDNRGTAGIERYIDDKVGIEAVHGATLTDRAPVRLSLDLAVQHALEDELDTATKRSRAEGAAGLVMDVETGEIVASVSLPGLDPARHAHTSDEIRLDKVSGGVFELGSIFKMMTIAMALEHGQARLDTIVDVTQPLTAGRFTFTDPHPLGRPMTVSEVFIHSSNVGAGYLALGAGPDLQRAFLAGMGLLDPIRTEAGTVASPLASADFDRATQITVSYGHGIAVAPIQFAAAAATLLNGGYKVAPTFLRRPPEEAGLRTRVVKEETSRAMREIMRQNVTDPAGTGSRAAVPGLDVGGKTGTAEIAKKGAYREKDVIASFVAAFPIAEPRYLIMVSLFEPEATAESNGQITAGMVAAPVAGRVMGRIAPLLGVIPQPVAGAEAP